MASRSEHTTPRAFTDKRFEQLGWAIAHLATRATASHRNQLTHDDLLMLFVKPSDRETCIASKKLFGTVRNGFTFQTPVEHGSATIDVVMGTNQRHTGVALPKYVGQHIHGDNAEAHAKLASWVEWRTKTAEAWGLVQAVFWSLHAACATPEQVRFFMPGILTLLDICEDHKYRAKPDLTAQRMADRMRAFRTPASLPSIPLELKRAAITASDTIACVGLLPCHVKEPDREFQQVRLVLGGMEMPYRSWDTAYKLPYLNTGY